MMQSFLEEVRLEGSLPCLTAESGGRCFFAEDYQFYG